jgi:hypothetical protein
MLWKELRQHHVLHCVQMRHQMELLENEPDSLTAEARQFPLPKLRCIGTVDAYRAARRLIQTAEQVQQRGFAGTGRPHDRDPFAALRRERDTIHRMHGRQAFAVNLLYVHQFDE